MEKMVYLERVDSTNRYARMLASEGAPHGTLVIANEQTGGRGRRGRSWISPAGEGIFMSLILRPQCAPEKTPMLSLQTALAVARAIHTVTGLEAKIKWPNDIVVCGKKVCGMLLEMDFSEGRLQSVVAGVGINVHQTVFPDEIVRTASSLDLLSGRRIPRKAVIDAFLREFEQTQKLMEDSGLFMDTYRAYSATLGQKVQVIALGETYTGTALEVTDSGSLIVLNEEGEHREVLAADVSVRGLMGYV